MSRVNTLSPGPVRGPRMDPQLPAGGAAAGDQRGAGDRASSLARPLGRLVEEEEVGAAVVAMLQMPGLYGADIDLSAGMVAR